MDTEEKLMKKWVKVYPIYIDKEVKLSEGRKVNVALGIEKPTVNDIKTVCTQFLNLKCKVEDHSHPKDWMKRGRVIVKLKNLDKTPIAKELPTKNKLLKVICETLIKHKQKPEVVVEDPRKRKKKKK